MQFIVLRCVLDLLLPKGMETRSRYLKDANGNDVAPIVLMLNMATQCVMRTTLRVSLRNYRISRLLLLMVNRMWISARGPNDLSTGLLPARIRVPTLLYIVKCRP